MAKGGKRPGSGRKSLSHEENVRDAIKSALGPESLTKIWKKIIQKAEEGSDRHAQLLCNYYYGKPKDNEGQPTELRITILDDSEY